MQTGAGRAFVSDEGTRLLNFPLLRKKREAPMVDRGRSQLYRLVISQFFTTARVRAILL